MNADYTGKQIAERRKELGMTQKALAEKLNVTDKAVSKWERGLNFPDLGLMEDLAQALDTTPAILLGLERADQDEVVTSLVQLSDQQLEDARRDIKWIGWVCVAAAILLIIAGSFIGSKVVRKSQLGNQLLQGITLTATVGGFYLLFKYKEIRKWNLGDWLIFYGAALPILLWNGIYFVTGYSPNDILTTVLIIIGAILTQLLFYRIMRPKLMKALPLLLSGGYILWMLWCGYSPMNAIAAAISCLAVWLVCRFRIPMAATCK